MGGEDGSFISYVTYSLPVSGPRGFSADNLRLLLSSGVQGQAVRHSKVGSAMLRREQMSLTHKYRIAQIILSWRQVEGSHCHMSHAANLLTSEGSQNPRSQVGWLTSIVILGT